MKTITEYSFQDLKWEEKVLSMPKIPRGSDGEPAALRTILSAVDNGESPKKTVYIDGSSSSATLERLAESLRPIGLVIKKDGNWIISDEAKEWLSEADDFYISAFFCSRIVFMGELLFALQNPKTITDLMNIANDDFKLNWKTKSEINNRLKWFRDLNLVSFMDFKNEYVLTESGISFLKSIKVAHPDDLSAAVIDETIDETIVDLSDWAYELCLDRQKTFEKRKSSIGYVVGGKHEMFKTINGYLRFIGERKTIEEISEYSTTLFSVKQSSVNAFMSMMNNAGLLEKVSRTEYSLTDLGRKCLNEGSILDLLTCLHCSFLFVFEILYELKDNSLSNKELAAIAKSAYGFNRESVDEMNSRLIMLLNANLIREKSLHRYTLTHRGQLLLDQIPIQKRTLVEDSNNDSIEALPVSNPYDDIITELRVAAKDSFSPNRLELAVKNVFELLGFDSEWIGHSGNTDVLLTSKGPKKTIYRVAVDAKSTTAGEITDGLVDFDTLKEHKQKHDADYVAIVGGKFTHNRLAKRAEEHGVALIDVDALESIYKLHNEAPINSEAFRNLFSQKGIVDISVLEKGTNSLRRYGQIIRLVVSCLIAESTDAVTDGVLNEREIYRSVRDAEIIKTPPSLEEIKDALEYLSSPVINGVKKSKDGYSATSSMEEIGRRFSFYAKCCKE